jgi:hypothetical protein
MTLFVVVLEALVIEIGFGTSKKLKFINLDLKVT